MEQRWMISLICPEGCIICFPELPGNPVCALRSHLSSHLYYYFNTKDELLNTLSMILDDNYEILKEKMDPDMNSYDKLLYLNYEAHSMIEEKINIDLLASLYSTQLVAQGHRSLLDQNRTYYKLISSVIDEGQKRGEISDEVSVSDLVRYYSMCERALVSDWCLNKGEYSLREYSKKCMPVMLEHFKR